MAQPHVAQQQPRQPVRAFTFGAPEAVLTNNIANYLGVFPSDDGTIYTPPASRVGLARLLQANAHHGAIPPFKRNLLLREFIPSRGFSLQAMNRSAMDFMVFGETYLLRKSSVFGQVLELEHLPAINMRVKVDGGYVMLMPDGGRLEFDQDEVCLLYTSPSPRDS